MSDVFVSYARPDEAQAKLVAEMLRSDGYQVWRDDELPAHRAYADVIEERISNASAVVVLWSAAAAKSQWVRAEADAARGSQTLIQASLDGTIPPMPFNQIQCADLNGWTGLPDTVGWATLRASVAALASKRQPTETAGPKQRKEQRSICVLPFANMSGDLEQEYFSDGISEDITTDLSKVSALAVTARNTAFQFKGQSIDVSDVAKRLGVTHVLEGSVRKAGGRVRITAQLIDGMTGDHVWADRYDRELTDIFAIQDEISKAIVDALKVKLLPEEKRAIQQRGTNSAKAYDLYLMAQDYWVTGNWGDVRQAELVERICKRAIDEDANYARAWGLLAIVQSILYFVHGTGDEDGLVAAERTLALDPDRAEAHIVKARHLHEEGRIEEARQALERATELGPDSWEVNHEAAIIHYFQRRYQDAARYFEKAASLVDKDFHSWGMLTSIYAVLGDQDKVRHAAEMALADSERVLAEDPLNGAALAMGATGLAILGDRERFYEWVDRALLVDPQNHIMAFNFACAMTLRLQDYDRAMDLIEQRFEDISISLFRASLIDPDIAALHDLPRYKALVAKTKARLGMTD